MSFDQDPNEQANISGADLAILVDDHKALQAQLAKELHAHRETGKALLGLQDKLAERAGDIFSLEDRVAERDKEIADLKQQVSALKSSPVSEEALDILRGENAQLRQQVLEQQARINDLLLIIERHTGLTRAMPDNLSALESALKAERLAGKIEGVEEAADKSVYKMTQKELRRMAAELKEGK